MDLIKDRRFGSFRIDTDELNRNPDIYYKLFGQCIIIRAEYMWHDFCIHYTAHNTSFAKVPHGQVPPEYTWTYDSNKNVWTAEVVKGKGLT